MDIDLLKKQLGLRLKELRVSKGFRQEDMQEFGFSYRHYGKLERGSANPTLETLARICEIFGVSLSDLFAFIDEIHPEKSEIHGVAIKIKEIFKKNEGEKIRKLKIFLDEIL